MKKRFILAMFFGLCTAALPVTVSAQSRQQSVTVVAKNKKMSLADALKRIQKLTGYNILFTYNDVKPYTVQGPVSVSTIVQTLDKVLAGKPFAYVIDGNYVSIVARQNNPRPSDQPLRRKKTTYIVAGHVLDSEQLGLPGATIKTSDGQTVISGSDGSFSLELPENERTMLTVSYIGMKTYVRTVTKATRNMVIQLIDDAKLDEVVVNGMFEQRKSSYTGATVSFNREQLKEVGNQNLLKSLKSLDPSFQIIDNNLAGSNPNAMPDIQLRGQTSFNIKGDYDGNQNQPLFILDGFETTLEKVNDLDMNRIQSVTLLKDAAAKAIYGSKAGNGVVVIQTVRPKSGEMRITYNGSLNIEAPDLTGYNLMNAQEKFDWENAHHKYDNWQVMYGGAQAADNLYKSVYDAIASGVDTYWLSKPLRTGVGQQHTISLEGGDSKVRYIVGAGYNNVAGVMKGSSRNTLNINSTLSYTYKNMVFRNQLDYDRNVSKNSPYGSFSDYVSLEPYYAPYDADGNVKQILGYETADGRYPVYNPLYNAQLNTKNQSDYTTFTENFEMDWHINENLRFTGQFSYQRQNTGSDVFYPASHTMFAEYDAEGLADRKGRYTQMNGFLQQIAAKAGVSYNRNFGKHYLFLNGTWNLSDINQGSTTVVAEGFGNDNMDNISMATSYQHDSHPSGSDSHTREVGFVGALNYSYAERYLLDASYRATGSSVYGSDNHWGGFWSVGAGYNIHNEPWFPKTLGFNLLKLRYSLGYTGTQNFNPYQARAMYSYGGTFYDGRMGATLLGLPNTSLRWQKVWDSNLGLDLNWKGIISLRAEYYVQNTDNMLSDITLPGSTGFQSYKENMGEIQNKGWELYLGITPWRDNANRGFVTLTASATRNKNTIKKIYDIFKKSNDDADSNFSATDPSQATGSATDEQYAEYKSKLTNPATKYYEGCSMTAIWGMRSLGIDPMSGKEMYLDKNGNVTYTWSADDQVVIGDTNPKMHGTLGLSAGWKGWSLSAIASYKLGGDLYNSTLIDRVENVTGFGNLDKRVAETWTQPGDNARYKAIEMKQTPNDLPDYTKPTSRFVQRNNELYLSSLNLSYDFYRMAWLHTLGLSYLRLSFIANDVARLSSIKIERGTDYPYARTFTFSVTATF